MAEAEIIQDDAGAIVGAIPVEKIAGRTVLITGASGIVGTYLLATLRTLVSAGNAAKKVFAVMRKEPPAHLDWLAKTPGFEILRGDLQDASFCLSLPNADLIIHAGGYGQPGKFMEDPLATIRLNLLPAFALVEKLNPEGRYHFVSTSEVYSGLPAPPYREDQIGSTNTDHPRSCYIEAKRCGEAICHAARAKGIAATASRLALAYGPGTRTDDQRVLNLFVKRALTEGRITMMDRGEAKRTYCYVADAARMIWQILLDGKETVYNVGGRSFTTIGDLAHLVGRLTGTEVIMPERIEALAGSPADVSLDMRRVETDFGPISYVELEEGLRRTVEWQKGLYSVSPSVLRGADE